MIDPLIYISVEVMDVLWREVGEDPLETVAVHEPPPSHWFELAHRDPVAGHDELLAGVKPAHDLTAVVAQFALADGFGHGDNVAPLRHAAAPSWSRG